MTSRTEDGIIEAIEKPDSTFCLAVQWHPEEFERDRRLFTGLVEAARDHMSKRAFTDTQPGGADRVAGLTESSLYKDNA